MNAEGVPNVGDRVRVIYEGEVTHANERDGRFRIAAARGPVWLGTYIGDIEVIEPALQVGWHRVVAGSLAMAPSDTVMARHWDGVQWGSAEHSHTTVRNAYRSIEFLGGGSDE